MSNPININGPESFKKEVLESKTPVLVDFWAQWCVPCQMMAPELEEIAKDYGEKLKIAKVDTETPDNQNLAMMFQIMSIPNLKLFKDGKIIKEFVGYRPKEVFTSELNPLLG